MELKEHLAILAIREKSKIGNVLAGYEVKDWPEGRLDKLIEMEMLISIEDATTIKCPCCSEGCSVEPVSGVANDGTEYCEVLCEIEGSCDVDLFYLKQWQITEKIKKYLPKTLKRRKRKASSDLSPREAEVYRMVHVEGKTPKQIAIDLNCSAQNVYKHLRSAEKKMRAMYSRSINLSKAQKLPEDRRGQSTIEADSSDPCSLD